MGHGGRKRPWGARLSNALTHKNQKATEPSRCAGSSGRGTEYVGEASARVPRWQLKATRQPHHVCRSAIAASSRAAKAVTVAGASTWTTRPRSVKNPNKNMSPDDVSARAPRAITAGEHAFWEGSQHDSRKLTCTTCHSVHDYKSETKQLKEKTQAAVCASCHRDKLAKLDRSGHMPVREGKLECTTCHNVHGTTNVRLLRKGDSIGETCTSCHADKRGPFLWEHAPSRDGCVTCHDPHGSSNERMLVAKPPILCQRCHVATRHPSTIYDAAVVGAGANPSIRIFARSCVTCHSAIHGSNHPSGERFIR